MINKTMLAVGVLALSAIGQASIIPVLISRTPSGVNTAFNYNLDLQQDERLDPAATNGTTCPGVPSQVACNPAGTFATLYDINGFVSASTSAPGWSVSTQLLGTTPGTVNGASFDSGTLTNVTFLYTGPVMHANGSVVPMSGFQIISSLSGTSRGTSSFQATKDTGSSSGSTDSGTNPVELPGNSSGIQAIPEPASMSLIGLGLAGLGLFARRRAQ